MKRRDFLKTVGLGAAALAIQGCNRLALQGKRSNKKQPNIVFIMADDMGYGDVGCYNADSLIPTPNMDRLAKQGVRFTDAHSPSAVCTPTRYGVLTGRYCWRTRLKHSVLNGFSQPLISQERLTVAELLKTHGYHTACIGKWHLGVGWQSKDGRAVTHPKDTKRVDFSKPITDGPNDHGFDYSFVTAACSKIDAPHCFIENDRTVGIPNIQIPVDKSLDGDFRVRPGLTTSDWVTEDVDLIFTKRAVDFIENHKNSNPQAPFFLYLPLSSPHAPWLAPERFKGKTKSGPRGDLVFQVDWSVGRIMDVLDNLKLSDNTLLIVTSDNGPRIGHKGHKSSGPYRGYKSHIWEGGHRVPFIARWPGKTKPNTTSDELICLTDLMATCAAIVAADLPDSAAEDSCNILPALLDAKLDKPIRDAIVHHSVKGVFAIRQGQWKLILETKTSGGWVRPRGKGPKSGAPGQLYNMTDDPYEQNDLYDKHPEIVKRLTDLLQKYRRQGYSRP